MPARTAATTIPVEAEARVRWTQVASFRLARHHLSSPARAKDLVRVVADMAGAQAQLPSAAAISLWARIRGLETAQVASAIGTDRTLARAWCMRRTVHLVPSEELAIYVRGTARRSEREITWMLGKGVAATEVERLIQSTLSSLDRPVTRGEIAAAVGGDLGLPVGVHRGGGWGNDRDHAGVQVGELTVPGEYLLSLAGARGVVCAGPIRSGEATFVRADAWLPHWHDLPAPEAESELLRRYLAAFGPALPEDFAWWTGMRLTDARSVWERAGKEIAGVDVEGTSLWALRDDLPALQRAAPAPSAVHLLPYFDGFLLGHRDERHAVRPEHRAQVYRPRGWVAPVVLHRGRAIGTWSQARRGAGMRVEVAPFTGLPSEVRQRIRSRSRDLARFLGERAVTPVIARPSGRRRRSG